MVFADTVQLRAQQYGDERTLQWRKWHRQCAVCVMHCCQVYGVYSDVLLHSAGARGANGGELGQAQWWRMVAL